MTRQFRSIPRWLLVLPLAWLLAACGGASDQAPDQKPVAHITSPADGATFRAGDTVTFAGDATDAEDGVIPATRLTWWADLHHDTHTHPQRLPSAGSNGTVPIPTRGETSDNIWYRFHLRATDSTGQSVEVTRDLLPRKSRITLATQPAGLGLTLDGQPVTAPTVFTGVVGMERDLDAPEQQAGGRRYRFAGWSQGGGAAQTISTPDLDTTYTATYTDVGPANNAPTVTLTAAGTGTVGIATTLSATAADSDGTIANVQFFDGTTLIGTDTTSPYSLSWTPTTAGSRSLTARATDNAGALTTSAAVTMTVSGPPNNPPSVALSAASTGTVGVAMTLTATAADTDGTIASVQFFDDTTSITTDTASPYSTAWTPSTAGSHSLTARATDNQGATATSTPVVVTVAPSSATDTQPPTAALISPVNYADGVTGTLSLAATASDNVGVVGVEFQIDGVTIGAEDTSSPYSASVDTSLYTAGQHVLRARARDAAGNLSPWSSATVRFGGSRSVPAGFTKNENWITGLGATTAFVQAPDGRFFIADQGGSLRVVKNGTLLSAPFVSLTVDPSGERGLIGVALHPNFASNGFVYVYYTATSPNTHNRVGRFVASGDVSTGVETVIADLPALSSATNHNGGAMKFGADGKLYVAVGDNANSALSQDLTKVFGKMLRFNDDGSIPPDNPFCTIAADLKCSIWARGLRNPFTFAVQPGTGRMHINDVGQGTWEEINLGAAGANFGWPGSEGPDNISAGVTAPLFTYKHSGATPAGSGPGGFFVGFAIAGGAFYPQSGGSFPAAYRGNYFFADYPAKFVGLLDLANGNVAYSFATLGGLPVDVLAGNDGALYVLTRTGVTRITAP